MCSSAADGAGTASFAVVSCPVAGLRARANPRSEMVNQEVFGRRLVVEEAGADWVLCRPEGGNASSRGWVPRRCLAPAPRYRPTHTVVKRFASLHLVDGGALVLPFGSLVEARGGHGASLAARLPGGGVGRIKPGALERPGEARADLRRFRVLARQVVGTPYLWGGKSTFGFDCSGLVQVLFGLLGVDLPRNSGEQARTGRPVRDLSRLQPLDLVFFGTGTAIDHVAIHTGNLSILHASGFVRFESLDPASDVFRADLSARFRLARRFTHL